MIARRLALEFVQIGPWEGAPEKIVLLLMLEKIANTAHSQYSKGVVVLVSHTFYLPKFWLGPSKSPRKIHCDEAFFHKIPLRAKRILNASHN